MRIEVTNKTASGVHQSCVNFDNVTEIYNVNGKAQICILGQDTPLNTVESYSDVMALIKAAEDKERMDKYACAVIASGQVMNLMALKYIEVPHAACDHMHNIDNFQNIYNEAI